MIAAPLTAALLAALALQTPAAPRAKPAPRACLQLSTSSSTQYTPVDDHTIVVRSFSDWWRLTTTPSTLLRFPQVILINEVHGPSTLCSPLDFQLSVTEPGGGPREGLIAQEFTPITPEEGRALLRAAHR